jgi:ABC-type spermidine/putrescine transport system permease subunit II
MNGLVLLGDASTAASTFCRDTSEILQLLGWALTIFKIIIPLIIIALGLVDLGKAAVSSKPEEIKKSATSLMWRLVGGIVIFFVPTIVMLVFGFVSGFSSNKSSVDFDKCYKCITAPWSDTCTNAVAEVSK